VASSAQPGPAALKGPRPGAAYSALIGTVASRTLPSALRRIAYRAFARAVGANLAEAELELDMYPSLGDFFARKLREGARHVDPATSAIISPCDGAIAAGGIATDGTLVQAKGRNYRLDELIPDAAFARTLLGGSYLTIYLSPRDYHRVHAPVGGKLVSYDYVPGTLWPVNRWATNRRDGLLARNERAIIRLNADGIGDVAVVMVGAAGVGNIALANAPESATFRRLRERQTIELGGRAIAKGDELGAFRLGSTVVLVFPPRAATLSDTLSAGTSVQFGQRIGTRSERGPTS
jgi:phosphatidylserine decarboxylase